MDHSLASTQRTCQINLLPAWNDDPPSWAQMSMKKLVPSRLQIWLTVAPFLIKTSALCHKSYLRGARCSGRKLRVSVDTNCRSSEYSCPPGKDKDRNLTKKQAKRKKNNGGNHDHGLQGDTRSYQQFKAFGKGFDTRPPSNGSRWNACVRARVPVDAWIRIVLGDSKKNDKLVTPHFAGPEATNN